MKDPFKNDQDILEALRSRVTSSVNAALRHLLGGKPKGAVRQKVYALGGNEEDAQEVLNQALMVFFNHVEDGIYDPALSAITTYIVNIAGKLYYTRRRSEIRRLARHDKAFEAEDTETNISPEDEMSLQETKTLLDKVLSMTGDRCRELLKLRSFDFSMAEIAEKMNYKSPDVVKAAAQDCRKKLNNILATRPELLAEFR